jgi:aminopeptidase N
VNHEGSGDQYDKGANMLHTIRQLVDDDARWRGIMRGLGKTFWHQTVSGKQIENYLSSRSGINLSKVFDQYLRTTKIPTLEYKLRGSKLSYRWSNVVPGFAMPVRVTTSPGKLTWIRPTQTWKTTTVKLNRPEDFHVDENFYVVAKDILRPATDSATARTAR